jgi:hypothetical protein
MARKMRELLWKLQEDTANEILELQQCEELSAWLEEPSEPNAVYFGENPHPVVPFAEEGTCARGLSLKTH